MPLCTRTLGIALALSLAPLMLVSSAPLGVDATTISHDGPAPRYSDQHTLQRISSSPRKARGPHVQGDSDASPYDDDDDENDIPLDNTPFIPSSALSPEEVLAVERPLSTGYLMSLSNQAQSPSDDEPDMLEEDIIDPLEGLGEAERILLATAASLPVPPPASLPPPPRVIYSSPYLLKNHLHDCQRARSLDMVFDVALFLLLCVAGLTCYSILTEKHDAVCDEEAHHPQYCCMKSSCCAMDAKKSQEPISTSEKSG